MAKIAGTLGSGRLEDFAPVKKVAEEVGISAATLKRWLNQNKVYGVAWGRDHRKWIYVEKDSIKRLKDHKNSIHLA